VALAVANQLLLHKQAANGPSVQASAGSLQASEAALGEQDEKDKKTAAHQTAPHQRYEFAAPLTEREAQLLLTLIGYRKGSTVITDNSGNIIGCVANPEDFKDFLHARNDSVHSVPSVFRLPSGGEPKFAIPPGDDFTIGQDIPVDRWIFGQHNKLLPVKASCRALANILLRDAASRENGVSLERAASEIAGEAVKLGNYLRDLDSKADVHRDDAFSFAFPYSDSRNGDKSRLRYANQFVGSLSKQGVFTGLPVELKLINTDSPRNGRLMLTEAGWKWAQLGNPILDGIAEPGLKRFADDEAAFLIEHIRKHVPAEDFAYRLVLTSISSGANTPEKLDDALEEFLPKRDEKPFTRAFLTTQRAGVVSRMIDLGLLQRVRDGIKASYIATTRSSEFSRKSTYKAG
jgi:hypothetical protein